MTWTIVQKHAFASSNRRTAFVAAKDFLIKNRAKFNIKDDALNSKIMIGIREGYYADSEIKEWIKHGTARQFRR